RSKWFRAILVKSLVPEIVTIVGLIILAIAYRLRRKRVKKNEGRISMEEPEAATAEDLELSGSDSGGQASRPANGKAPSAPAQPRSLSRLAVPTPRELYGAYRVDQEVGKLVLGQVHRLDVLSSRALEDRRAIEASLLKVLTSLSSDDDQRLRARNALEEYGFVSEQCAALLLANDPYERNSAAKLLGDMKSLASLPFLLEALYDAEAIVRNQAVVSIGALKLPAAIGALLDIGRRYPEVPATLLTRALSECSVEGLNFFEAPNYSTSLLSSSDDGAERELTQLEPSAE